MIHPGNLAGKAPLGIKAPRPSKSAGRDHMARVAALPWSTSVTRTPARSTPSRAASASEKSLSPMTPSDVAKLVCNGAGSLVPFSRRNAAMSAAGSTSLSPSLEGSRNRFGIRVRAWYFSGSRSHV